MRDQFGGGAFRVGRVGLLAIALAACDVDDGPSVPCGGGTCGFVDHKYFSVYSCALGGTIGLSWRILDHCLRQCETAAAWGCNVGGCSAGCVTDHGTGVWMPCTSAPTGGEVRESGCFLQGSGLSGETVPCDCR